MMAHRLACSTYLLPFFVFTYGPSPWDQKNAIDLDCDLELFEVGDTVSRFSHDHLCPDADLDEGPQK